MKYLLSLIVLLSIGNFVWSKDLGVLGNSFAITEQDILHYIQRKLHRMQREGILAKKNQQLKDRAISYVKSPPPVKGIGTSRKKIHWYFNPTLTVTRDILDAEGKVFVKKGTTVNPLQYMPLTQTLIFIDGSKTSQVDFAVNKILGRKKIILTKGKTFALMKKYHMPLYFDQKGTLVKRFGISNVPATVVQEGMLLRIEEVPVEEASTND